MEGKTCSLAISYQGRTVQTTLLVYSKREPPAAAEVQRAYHVWDTLKRIAGLADLPDDCRQEVEIWSIPPRDCP
jgi:hypothetical protein